LWEIYFNLRDYTWRDSDEMIEKFNKIIKFGRENVKPIQQNIGAIYAVKNLKTSKKILYKYRKCIK